jgi:hypothetical protein
MADSILDDERQSLLRFLKFLAGLIVFFGSIFFLGFENIHYAFLLFFLVIVLFFANMIHGVLKNPRYDALQNILTDEELAHMHKDDSEEEHATTGSERMAQYSLEDTPKIVRSCQEEITILRPKSGRYSVVYNAVYFGKSIRSESDLHLHFEEAKARNGWEISGSVVSGGQNSAKIERPIEEGFLNTRGEMYWTLSNPNKDASQEGIYRGCFDLRSSALYDGEFRAGSSPPGRIVRMELAEEESENRSGLPSGDDWGSPNIGGDWDAQDVEMVELA